MSVTLSYPSLWTSASPVCLNGLQDGILSPSGKGKTRQRRKRLPASRRAIKKEEEEELTESSEQEDEDEDDDEQQVVYMDSDDEKMKQVVELERKLEREEEEHEEEQEEEEEEEEEEEAKPVVAARVVAPEEARVVAPEEGPPATMGSPTKQKREALGTFKYQVVERPCFGPVRHREKPVHSTLVDARGNLLDTLQGLEPRVLRCGTQHSPLAMLQVSCSELFDFLTRRADCLQDDSSQKKPGKRLRFARNNPSMDYRLMAAVTPWIGNLLVPDPTCGGGTGAFALRQRTQAMSLGSTPVFRLFLQVLRVDLLGCKDTIEKRQREARGPPLRFPSHVHNPNTVQGMLHEKHKRAQELKELQKCPPQPVQFPAPQPLLNQAQASLSPQVQSRLMLMPPIAPQSPSMPPQLRPHSSPGVPSNPRPVSQPVVPPQMTALQFPPPKVLVNPPNLQLCSSPRQQSPGAVTFLPRIAPAGSHANALLPIQARPSLSPSSAAPPARPAAASTPGSPVATRLRGVKRGRANEPSPGQPSPLANQSSAGESQEVKRVRRMTAKAKALEEETQAKVPACATLNK